MTKAELDTLELVTESIHAHQKCPNLQKTLEDEKLQCEEKLNSSLKDLSDTKAKMETDAVTTAKLKQMCEEQLRKADVLQKKAKMFDELGQKIDETEQSGTLKESFAAVKASNMVLEDKLDELTNEVKSLKQANEDQNMRIETILEFNQFLRKGVNILSDEKAAQKQEIKTLREESETQKQEIKTLRDESAAQKKIHMESNDELREIIRTIDENIQLQFRDLFKLVCSDE